MLTKCSPAAAAAVAAVIAEAITIDCCDTLGNDFAALRLLDQFFLCVCVCVNVFMCCCKPNSYSCVELP